MTPPVRLRYIATTISMLNAGMLFTPVPASAQERASPQASALRVFLDCRRCDFDHFRREVTFVDYMRDRTEAEVHVLVTSQDTGAGGSQYAFYFIGQDEFEGRQDTLYFSSTQDMTDDDVRTGLTRTFALGLVPFAARTNLGVAMNVHYEPGEEAEPARSTPADDPWNLWVFRLRMGGSIDGERLQSSASTNGSISANRTTESLKFGVNADARYEEEHFELSDGEKVSSLTRNASLESTIVFSLNDHWSAGFRGNISTSTRSNNDITLRASPAVEYDIYRYAESTRRQITLMYTLGPVYYRYDQETLFEKTDELRLQQHLDVSAAFRQPWGDVHLSVRGRNYLDDWHQHRIELNGGLDIRLFRGFGLDVNGNVARIKDQLNVPIEDASDEDVLLQLRELGTDFEYELEIGFSYTFGSVFNNVVNPRMWRGGGGFRGFN